MDDISRLEQENQILKDLNSSIDQVIKEFTKNLACLESKCDQARLQVYKILEELVPLDSRTEGSIGGIPRHYFDDKEALEKEIEDFKRITIEHIGTWRKRTEDSTRLVNEGKYWNHLKEVLPQITEENEKTEELSVEVEELRAENSGLYARKSDLELKLQHQEIDESSMQENIRNLRLKLGTEEEKMAALENLHNLQADERSRLEKEVSDLKAESENMKVTNMDLAFEINELKQKLEENKETHDAAFQQLIEDKQGPQVACNERSTMDLGAVESLSTSKNLAAAGDEQITKPKTIEELKSEVRKLGADKNKLEEKKELSSINLDRGKLQLFFSEYQKDKRTEMRIRGGIDRVSRDTTSMRDSNGRLEEGFHGEKQVEQEELSKDEELKAEIESLKRWNDEARKSVEMSIAGLVKRGLEKLQTEYRAMKTQNASLHEATSSKT